MEREIMFLNLADVLEIHQDQIGRYGGYGGLRDYDLLCSAVAMPEVSYAGNYLHKDIYEMAAAYVFHLCQNHPFIDGNKRTALAAGLVFLELNGITVWDTAGKLYDIVMAVATGKLDKAGLADVLRQLAVSQM